MEQRGRPRQPFCLDCKREGHTDVPKRIGQGYCEEHYKKRQKVSRERTRQLQEMETIYDRVIQQYGPPPDYDGPSQ